MNSKARFPGFPLFDTAEFIHEQAELALYPDLRAALAALPLDQDSVEQDYLVSQRFLVKYSDVSGTYNRFRSEVQRFLNYLWLIARRQLSQVDTDTVSSYFTFLKTPPAAWVSQGIYPAFVAQDDLRRSNPAWRPMAQRSKTRKTPTLCRRPA